MDTTCLAERRNYGLCSLYDQHKQLLKEHHDRKIQETIAHYVIRIYTQIGCEGTCYKIYTANATQLTPHTEKGILQVNERKCCKMSNAPVLSKPCAQQSFIVP